MLRILRKLFLSALLILVGGCTPSAAPDESEVLISLTDRIIVPGYEALAAEAQDLRQVLDSLCAAPSDATLQAAQQAWRDVREPWMRSEATWGGPVMDRRAVSVMDWSPTDPDRIEKMLANNPAVTEAAVREGLSSTQRGLGAIEYLLFDSAALERLSGPASVHCRYLTALGHVVESEARAIVADWTEVGEKGRAYRDFFTGRSDSSLLKGQAVAELVRTQVFLIRTITDMRLAAALGLRQGGPDPAAIPRRGRPQLPRRPPSRDTGHAGHVPGARRERRPSGRARYFRAHRPLVRRDGPAHARPIRGRARGHRSRRAAAACGAPRAAAAGAGRP